MVGARLKIFILTAIATFAVNTARAADYQQPPPPPVYVQPPPQECCDNWYLRGFVGAGLNASYKLDYIPGAATDFAFDHKSIADTLFIGGAFGYDWNNWLRFDVSAEYRAKARVYAFGHYTSGGGTFLDTYQGNLKSWVFLANAFVDLGTWNCFTPFVGAGFGGAYNTLSDFTDINPSVAGWGFGRNPSEWHFAYALYAGVGYNVSKSLKIDLSYRYLSFGSITDTIDCAAGCTHDSYKFGNLYSHDIMLGLRWTCCDTAPPAPRYVYTPPPQYVPPPQYSPPPPPLHSRG